MNTNKDESSQSIEELTHFKCKDCQKWWSVSEAPKEKQEWFCAWCGNMQ